MEDEMLLSLLDRPIAFHRVFVDITGSITAALMLSQAMYWQRRTKHETGWWYKTQEEWNREIGFSRWELEQARKNLINIGILQYTRKGASPARSWYRVDFSVLKQQIASLQQTSLLEDNKLDCHSATNKTAREQQSLYTETTTETSSENTSKKQSRSRSSDSHHGFDDFWKLYPRHVNKQQALKVWNKLKPDDHLQATIHAAIKRQSRTEQWLKDDGKFIPHASTWLNGCRWEDEEREHRKPRFYGIPGLGAGI